MNEAKLVRNTLKKYFVSVAGQVPWQLRLTLFDHEQEPKSSSDEESQAIKVRALLEAHEPFSGLTNFPRTDYNFSKLHQ